MQQFTVPQFIDVEDKIVGPLSVRQFIILIVSGGLTALCYKLFDFSLFIVSGIILIMSGACFAFVKVRGLNLASFLLVMFQTLSRPSLRVWNKVPELEPIDPSEIPHKPKPLESNKRYNDSHLNKLALIVDTKGYYSGEDEEGRIYKEGSSLDDMLID